jgi:hypothetical protein
MIPLAAAILLLPYCPGDSARALISLREVPVRALLFAEQAARIDGRGVVELAVLLELSGRFQEAARVYSLAAASPGEISDWLEDRIRGVSALDTTLVLEAVLRNRGDSAARKVVLMMPRPCSHEPFQHLSIIESDFTGGGPVLTCMVDSLPPGGMITRNTVVRITQRPFTFRPIDPVLTDSVLADMVLLAGQVEGTRDDPGPCLEMSRELVRRAGRNRLPMHVEGGLVFRGDSLVFHAWAVLDTLIPGLPVDPLLYRSDSMMAVGHCPADMIPLWNLDVTEGCELSALFSGAGTNLEMSMRAYFAGL